MQKLKLLLILILGSGILNAQIPSDHLYLWYCADSVIVNSGKVSQIYDMSGNEYHAIQNTETNKPTLVENIINNNPVLRFAGNNWLKFQFPSAIPHPISIFVIWNVTTAANQACYCNYSTSIFDLQSYNGGIQIYSGSVVGYTKPSTFDFILNSNVYNTSSSKVYENGLFVASGNSGAESMNGITIGALFNNTWCLYGDIAEIIMYDAVLTDLDRVDVENYLMDKYSPDLFTGDDIVVDYGFCDTLINIDTSFSDILWSTGETNDSIYVNQSGQYWVQAKDIFGRLQYDTINVEFLNPSLPNSSICLGDSTYYDPELIGAYDYLWSDAGTESSKYLKDAGDYWLRMEDAFGCFDTVFFSIEVDSFKNNISLGNDTSLCSGNTISLLNGEELCASFLWTPSGNTNPIQIVTESGWQKIEVENSIGCTAIDSIYVTVVGTAPIPVYTVENICFGETTQFIDNSTPVGDIASWKWVVNETDTLFTQNAEWLFETTGIQNIELIVESLSGCSNSTSFDIEIKDVPTVSFSYLPICTNTPAEFISAIDIPDLSNLLSVSWYINNVFASNTTNLIHSFDNPGDYEIKLIAELDNLCTGAYIETISIPASYQPAEPFSLSSPLTKVYDLDVDFIWSQSENSIFYKLLIATSSDFSDLTHSIDSIFSTNYEITFEEITDTIFWKVIAYNPCLVETSSEIGYFTYFSPNLLPNLNLWLSADSVEIIDSRVATWFDKSGNGYAPNQTNASNRPTKVENVLGGKPVIRFNGSNWIKYQFPTVIPQPVTTFTIWRATNTTSQACYCNYSSSIFDLQSYNSEIQFYAGSIVGYSKTAPFGFILNSTIYNGTNSSIYENSILQASGNSSTGTMNGITVGALYNNSWGLVGDIAEIIMFDTILSEVDRINVENYLMRKYAPPVNLSYDIRVPYGFCDTAITTAYKPWFTDYEWSTGETDSVIHVNRPGVYSVTVTDIFGFESSDDIRVFYPDVNDFADTVVCFGNSVVWDAELMGDYSFAWYGSSETTRAITIDAEGDYAVIVNDTLGCQYLSDTISFSFDNYEFTASIGPADTSLCSGNRIMLVTNRPETVSYLWSTGSTLPEIVLASSGTYSVTTTNWRGCEANDEIDVTITGTVPVPLFSSEGHCAQNPVYFTDLSTSSDGTINSWTWSINGNIFSTEQNPVLAESNPQLETSEPETNEITLVISTDAGCSDFIITPITIYPLPVISFSPNYFCQYAPVEFSSTAQVDGGTITENIWDFNGTQQIGDNITHTFTQSGNNPITLTSTSDVGCRDSLVTEVYVKNASLPVFSTENACEGSEIYFINNTEVLAHNLPLEWNWDFGDGSTGTGSDPAHIYENAGVYDVAVSVVWQNMCEVPATAQVEVYHNPSLSLLAEDQCINIPFHITKTEESLSGEIISHYWVFGSENPIVSTHPTPQFSSSVLGEYPVSLNIETEFGCVANAVDTVIVHGNPHASFTPSRVWGAVPMEVEFTNNSEGASTYLWSFGDTGTATDEDPVYIFTGEGEFDVVLQSYSQFGCVDDTVIRIKTVIPILDVILYDLRPVMSGNYLQTNVYVINNGTLPVNNAEITLDLGDGKIFRENIEYLAPSQVLDYKFNMEVYRADGKVPEVVCTEIYAPPFEGYAETTVDDNLLCNTDVETLRVYQPYPNPATGELNLSFILESESDVTITLINGIGEQVYKNSMSNKSGYQKHIINVSDLTPGVYYLQVVAGDEVRSFKVEVL